MVTVRVKDTASFKLKAEKVHEGRYDYSKVRHSGSTISVEIGCPKCKTVISKAHRKVIDHLVEIGYKEDVDFTVNDRSVLFNKESGKFRELDIYFPSLKLGVEVDGVLYHGQHKNSHMFVDVEEVKERDLQKERLCLEQDITLIKLTDIEITEGWQTVQGKLQLCLSNF